MAAPKKVDYERIEPGWRAGILSPGQLATQYTAATGIPCSRSAIIKHFDKLGVPRDLKAKIQAKAEAMVAQSMVTGMVSTATTATSAAIIDRAATDVAKVQISHRTDIARARVLGMQLFAEVEAQTTAPQLLQEVERLLAGVPKGTALTDLPDAEQKALRAKLGESLNKALALGSRTVTYKALVESLTRLVSLEREAYGINADTDPDDPLSSLLRNLKARTFQPVADDVDHAT
ncbi:hypothetical protein [Polaromonas sp.]|uniref:hypothetical protein n=1 Tax=Polaromonas sp. TaxID=1869339 RepID=UPI0032667829